MHAFRSFVIRTLLTLTYFVLIIAIGTIGYALLEGWPVGDGLYMTVITITAVGYDEVRPLTSQGRVFTSVLLGLGLTGMGIWFALVTSLLVELDLRDTFIRRRMDKTISGLRHHYILCGAGRAGRRVVEELSSARTAFVVIERDPDRVARLAEAFPDVLFVEGDATHNEILRRAGIDHAHGLVTALSEDADNVYVCLSARALREDLNIVSRAAEEESAEKLRLAGANHVVSPNVSGALQMTAFLMRPGVVSFLDVVSRSPELFLRMEVTSIPADSALVGQTLKGAAIREKTGLIVIAVRKAGLRANEGYLFNPSAETVLEVDDQLVVLGEPDQVHRLQAYAGTRPAEELSVS